jgi:hypothetical protein
MVVVCDGVGPEEFASVEVAVDEGRTLVADCALVLVFVRGEVELASA